MSVSTTVKKFGIEQAIKYMYKDPDKNLVNLMDWADKFSKGEFEPQRKSHPSCYRRSNRSVLCIYPSHDE